MTERVEVLTDGGSALYGSDAVAGVVNVIMRTDFEGLELFADTSGHRRIRWYLRADVQRYLGNEL